MADDLTKKRLVRKPQYSNPNKPLLPTKPRHSLDMGGITQPPGQTMPPLSDGASEEEPQYDQGETGKSQSPSQKKDGGKKPSEGADKAGKDTPKTPGEGGGKPGGISDTNKAAQLASGSPEDKKEAVKKELYDAAVNKLALAGPYGRAAAIVLKAIPWIKKYWHIPVVLILGIVFILASLASCSQLDRDAGGGTLKEPINILDTKTDLINVRTFGTTQELAKFTQDVIARQDEIIKAMQDLLGKENEQIRGANQKANLTSLLDQYLKKLQKLRDYVAQIQAKELNIKPEEGLSEDEFKGRNELQNNINSTFLELNDLMAKLKKEFNRCDAVSSQEPNELGFYHLENSGLYEKFVSSSHNSSKEPFFLEAMPYCATIYVATQFKAQTGKKLWVGEASFADGSSMVDFSSNRGHLDGRTVIYSGPGIARNSKDLFGVDYDQNLAKWFANLLYKTGVGLVYFNDSDLNNQTTTNLLGDTVPLANPGSGISDHWSVSFTFLDL
ncbi:MAG: hypothetical protein ACD_58C00317G0001 [uncultured bacterium]|nr:MAG: hypothetical protein ACD_58C00317G0001 [uncultured bacterium]